MKQRKRMLALVLCGAVLMALILPVSGEEELDLASEAAVLMDADTGMVLYQKNMHEELYPASITKLMTALLAIQNLNPEDVLTVSQSAVDAVPRTSSHISLLTGEQLTVEQALYAIGMASANDAANVLAEAVAGSLESFAQLMTETAESLGAENTHFANANGLPDSNHYTTAYDMALITAAAWKQEGLATYFSTINYTIPATNLSAARSFQNKDRLLPGGQYYYEGVQMAKTGWTSSAQGTFAAVVTLGGVTLVVVTMKSPQLEDKYKDTHKLLDYGFSHYTRVTVTGEEIAAQLDLGEFTPVSGQTFSYLIPSEMSKDEIDYALASTDLEEERRNTLTVDIYASIQELRLQDATLKLERPAKAREAYALSELLEGQSVSLEDLPLALRIAAVVGLLVLVVLLLRWFIHLHRRHVRRKHLKARIRRMKKKME